MMAQYTPFPTPVPGPRPYHLHLVDTWDAPESTFATLPPRVAPADIPAELRRLADAVEGAPAAVVAGCIPGWVAGELRRLAGRVAPEGGKS